MSNGSSLESAGSVCDCHDLGGTPVRITAESLRSVEPSYLRAVSDRLLADDRYPAELYIDTRFDSDRPLDTQSECERIRSYLKAGKDLGVNAVTVSCQGETDEDAVRSALRACAERAERDGLVFNIEGSV